MKEPNELIEAREKMAELEHEQWMQWSKAIANNPKEFYVDKPKLVKWMDCWKPYAELTEEQKDQDRVWADKILSLSGDNWSLAIVRENGELPNDAIYRPPKQEEAYCAGRDTVVKAGYKQVIKQEVKNET